MDNIYAERKAFHDALKAVSYLKKMERNRNEDKQAEFEENNILITFGHLLKGVRKVNCLQIPHAQLSERLRQTTTIPANIQLHLVLILIN